MGLQAGECPSWVGQRDLILKSYYEIGYMFHNNTPSFIYKGPTYKGFFWPGLKVLADLRNLRAENYSAKGLSQEKKIGQEISLIIFAPP